MKIDQFGNLLKLIVPDSYTHNGTKVPKVVISEKYSSNNCFHCTFYVDLLYVTKLASGKNLLCTSVTSLICWWSEITLLPEEALEFSGKIWLNNRSAFSPLGSVPRWWNSGSTNRKLNFLQLYSRAQILLIWYKPRMIIFSESVLFHKYSQKCH